MEQILVNNGLGWESLDLYPKENISINFQITKIGDIARRAATFSNTLTIPRTAKNQSLLGDVGTMGNTSRTAYIKLDCKVVKNNIVIIENGVLVLTESTPEIYKLNVYDGIIDLKDQLSDLTLRDLDMSSADHVFSYTNFVASHANTSGYIYAFADWGQPVYGTGTIEETSHQAPSYFAHTIFNKIFASRGLTVSGDFFTTNTEWKELVITAGLGYSNDSGSVSETPAGTADTSLLVVSGVSSGASNPKTYTHDFTSDTFTADLSRTAGEIVSNFVGTLNLDFSFTTTVANNTRGEIDILFNGVWKDTVEFNSNGVIDSSYSFGVVATDVVSLEVRLYPNIDYIGGTTPPFLFDATVDSAVTCTKVTGGTDITASPMMPKIKQIDFIKDILQKYGLLMTRSRVNINEYRFIYLDDLLSDKANAVDWTGKVISIGSENYSSGYAIENIADYSYAGDIASSLDGTLITDNENASPSRTLFKSPFVIPEKSSSITGGKTLFSIPIWKVKNDDTVEPIENKGSMMRLEYSTLDVPTYTYYPSGSATITSDVPYLSTNDIDYQYYFDTYYSKFKEVLDNYKEIDVELDLNEIDIHELDLIKLVYLRQSGRYYFIDNIKVKGNKSKAKLIEIP